jgi:hypothetical protein
MGEATGTDIVATMAELEVRGKDGETETTDVIMQGVVTTIADEDRV